MKSTPIVNPTSMAVASDLSGSVSCAVVDTSTGLTLPSAGGPISGVLLTKADAAGDFAAVQTLGPCPVLAIGTFDKGDRLKVDAAGKFLLATATDISAGRSVARALEAGASGRLVNVYLYPNSAGAVSGTESIVAPGALAVGAETSELSIDGTDAYTLANGYYVGQRHRVRVVAVAGTPIGTLTTATMFAGQPATFVFTALAQELVLEWTATGYKVVEIKSAGTEVVANAGTANPLVLHHHVVIADTVDFIQGAGLVAGQLSSWIADSNSGTPVGTVSGLFYDEDGTADGIDILMNAGADAAKLVWDGARWDAYLLTSATIGT